MLQYLYVGVRDDNALWATLTEAEAIRAIEDFRFMRSRLAEPKVVRYRLVEATNMELESPSQPARLVANGLEQL